MSILQNFLYDSERDHWWYQARRTIMEHIFWKNIVTIQKKKKILSVGCGTGQELIALSHYGKVVGLDIDSVTISLCKKQGFCVEKGDICEPPFKDETFDIIVAMDVIEHIENDSKAIESLFKLLKKGGKLLITVPACPFLWSTYDEMGEFPHYRRYTYLSLYRLLSSRFTIKKLSYYNFFLFPLVFIMRKMNFGFYQQLSQPSFFMNKVCYFIFSLEKFFLLKFSFPIGVSLIGICEKKDK